MPLYWFFIPCAMLVTIVLYSCLYRHIEEILYYRTVYGSSPAREDYLILVLLIAGSAYLTSRWVAYFLG